MSTPAWILEIFAAVMLLVAEVSAGQLVIARAWIRRGGTDADIAVSHLLMGIAMAGILVPGLSTLPNAIWEIVFAVMTAWFVGCLWRESRGRGGAAVADGHYAPHLVRSAAMLYVFAALARPSVEGSGMSMSGAGGMSGMAGGSSGGMPTLHAPTLALIFALLLIAFTVHDLDRPVGVDGYFHVVGHRSVPAGSVLAAAAADPAAVAIQQASVVSLSTALRDSLHPGERAQNVLPQPPPTVLDEVFRPVRILLGHPAQAAPAGTMGERFAHPGAVWRHGLQLAAPVGRHHAGLPRIREHCPCEGARAPGLRDDARHCPFESVTCTIAAGEPGACADAGNLLQPCGVHALRAPFGNPGDVGEQIPHGPGIG